MEWKWVFDRFEELLLVTSGEYALKIAAGYVGITIKN